MSSDHANTINATETSIEILEYVVEAEGPVGISRIADDLDLPKSMAYNHLSTLRDCGYVVKRDRKYDASLRPLLLGNRIRDGMNVFTDGYEHVDNLVKATGETVELFIKEEHWVVPVCIVGGQEDWTSPHRVGDRTLLHRNPPGKVILSSLSDERADEVLSAAMAAAPAAESSDREAIRDDIRRARDSGSLFSRGERHPDVVTVSSPIETPASTPPASLAIAGPADRLQGRYLEEDLVGQLIPTTEAISSALSE